MPSRSISSRSSGRSLRGLAFARGNVRVIAYPREKGAAELLLELRVGIRAPETCRAALAAGVARGGELCFHLARVLTVSSRPCSVAGFCLETPPRGREDSALGDFREGIPVPWPADQADGVAICGRNVRARRPASPPRSMGLGLEAFACTSSKRSNGCVIPVEIAPVCAEHAGRVLVVRAIETFPESAEYLVEDGPRGREIGE